MIAPHGGVLESWIHPALSRPNSIASLNQVTCMCVCVCVWEGGREGTGFSGLPNQAESSTVGSCALVRVML